MFPYIYQSNGITIGSYGVMLAIAYLTGRYLFLTNLTQKTPSPPNTEVLIFLLLALGVLGAKLMFIIKNPELGSLFELKSWSSPQGFSSQGAVLAALIVTLSYAKLTKIKLHNLLDSAAPAVIIAYAIARFGCFLSGDECWGIDSNLPWAMSFPNGIKPTSVDQTVHPLPLYEIIYSIAIWQFLGIKQKSKNEPYELFLYLLIFWGACRFLIEFISTNSIKIFGMTGSQFGALLMLIIGLSFITYNRLILNKKKPGK